MKPRKPVNRVAAWLDSARHLVDADWQRNQWMRERMEKDFPGARDIWPAEPEPVEYRAASDSALSLEDLASVVKGDPAKIRWGGKNLAHAAAAEGNLEKLRWLVEHGVDPNQCGANGSSPLVAVAERRKPQRDAIIRYLLSIRACQGAEFALNLSLSMGRFEIAREQIAAGADPEGYEFSALHQAAAWGDSEQILAAIGQRDDLEARDRQGRTPWLVAVQAGRIEVASLLAGRGAKTRVTSVSGETAMHFAAEGNHPTMIRHLAAAGHSIATMSNGMKCTPLDTAVTYDSVAAATALVRLGASVTTKAHMGEEAIHQARSVEMLELLFTHGASLNKINYAGEWPLKNFAQEGHLEGVRWLLNHGAIVDNCTDAGGTALFSAVMGNHLEIAELLLENGANASAVDLDGDTPLSLCRTPAMENLLLRYGAKTWPAR